MIPSKICELTGTSPMSTATETAFFDVLVLTDFLLVLRMG